MDKDCAPGWGLKETSRCSVSSPEARSPTVPSPQGGAAPSHAGPLPQPPQKCLLGTERGHRSVLVAPSEMEKEPSRILTAGPIRSWAPRETL